MTVRASDVGLSFCAAAMGFGASYVGLTVPAVIIAISGFITSAILAHLPLSKRTAVYSVAMGCGTLIGAALK